MTDTALAITAAAGGLLALGIAWLTSSPHLALVGAVAWSLAAARLTADRAARGMNP